MTDKITEHPLYNACVGYMVSEKSHADSWTSVVNFVQTCLTNGTDIASEFKVVETQVKADFKVKSLPAAWRSAKSVAISAVTQGVVLTEDGKPLGKTAVERRVRLAKAGTVPDRSLKRVARGLKWVHETLSVYTSKPDWNKDPQLRDGILDHAEAILHTVRTLNAK